MAKYRVWAQSISDVYIDIEAKDADQAYDYAKNEADGGDFHDNGFGDWVMNPGDVQELDDDAEVDYSVNEEE